MSLRNAHSTGDIAFRRFCTHFTFPDADDKPTPPPSPPPPLPVDELSSLAGSQSTETDQEGCSHSEYVDEFQFDFDFPQPPSTLRRMHSSPWCTPEQQPTPFFAKAERRHSASPLLQCSENWIYQQRATNTAHTMQARQGNRMEMMGEAFVRRDLIGRPCVYGDRAAPSNSLQRSHSITQYREPLFSARMQRPSRPRPLPPPATPAPSTPLPHIPNNIRKAESMHLDSRCTSSSEPVNATITARGPVSKARPFKFLSGFTLDNSRVSQNQSQNDAEGMNKSGLRNVPRTVGAPATRPSYMQAYEYTRENPPSTVPNSSFNQRVNDLHLNQKRASMAMRSSPSLVPGNSFTTRPRTMLTFGNSQPCFETRSTPTPTPPALDYRNRQRTPVPRSHYLPHKNSYISQVSSAYSHHRNVPMDGTRTSSRPYAYGVSRDSRPSSHPSHRGMHNTATDVGVPRSFMDVTPDKPKDSARWSRFKPQGSAERLHRGSKTSQGRTRGGGISGEEHGMKKRNKVRRLLTWAGKGLVDWSRHLSGRKKNCE